MNKFTLNNLQKKLIPIIREGVNTIIQSPPGSGKTLCYSIPVTEQKKSIILTPTKELSIQVYQSIRLADPNIKVTRLGSIGFVSPIVEMISDQEAKTQSRYVKDRINLMNQSLCRTLDWNKIDVCITTPVQLASLLKFGCKINDANCLVLDEADLLLGDIDFYQSIQSIVRSLTVNQYIICSSVNNVTNLSPLGERLRYNTYVAKDYMGFPKQTIDFLSKPIDTYLQNQKTIIFVENQTQCLELHQQISDSVYFHSELTVEDRVYLLEAFKSQKISTLITTGLGSRGLDFPDVTQVILYDLPQNYAAFLLQCGRLRGSNKKIIVRLKDSMQSALFNEYEQFKYTFPKECVKI